MGVVRVIFSFLFRANLLMVVITGMGRLVILFTFVRNFVIKGSVFLLVILVFFFKFVFIE